MLTEQNEALKTVSDIELENEEFQKEILNDYRIACESREASLLGRKEVLTGKAKFGIFGDGKEVPQLAMAKAFQPGDFRSGYYRDQTFMFASELATVEQFFAQLYANPDLEQEPFSGGRQMNAHFATRSLDEHGNWKSLTDKKNSSADTSPTASQMARAVGLAMASKYYRQNPGLADYTNFSKEGNEVTFCTIGDASTSEGIFWEALNAAGVMKIPMVVSVWDDGYGISVPRKYQTTKGSISDILEGFRVNEDGEGYDIYKVKAWDYDALCEAYINGVAKVRETHIPAIFHIQECTQPQGHSTSGSHERYKSPERLQWEEDFDCIKKMREWILELELATAAQLDEIEDKAKQHVNDSKRSAWDNYINPIKADMAAVSTLMDNLAAESQVGAEVLAIKEKMNKTLGAINRDVMSAVRQCIRVTRHESGPARDQLVAWKKEKDAVHYNRYNSFLHSESDQSALNVPEIKPVYTDASPMKNGFEVLNACFDAALDREPLFMAFGEDLGNIGDVNQGFAGLQEKYGQLRVFDTGIREATIMGQGIGLAMRGLRPLAEIQYLDYLIYGLQPLTDDLATLQYRTKGGQKAPMIVRTRGHRLEGIWHTGSPIGMVLHSLRGIYVLVPRNMTQAAGFYNTMLQSDDPALIIECLNGYRLKEKLPDNVGEFTVPLGVPEVIHEGTDITIVTYGSSCRIAMEAVEELEKNDISCEVIDVQTLLPFDLNHSIVDSLKKTNKVLFLDEDVPGGASAYIMQQVLEEQEGYYYLDVKPATLAAKPHRAAYASDGDYFSKPSADDVFDTVYAIMHDVEPTKFPLY